MKKKFSVKLLLSLFLPVLILFYSCFWDNQDNLTDSIQPVQLKISFETRAQANTRVIAEGVTFVLLSIKDQNGYLIFNKAKFKVYPMGQMYVTEAIGFTGRDGNYAVTEFLVLDKTERIIYAAPVAGSGQASLVHKPLPYTFTVINGEIAAVPLEVVEVDSSVNPADLGYINLGFMLAEASVNKGLAAEYMFYGDYRDTSGGNNPILRQGGSLGEDRAGNPESACGLSADPTGLGLTNPISGTVISLSLWLKYEATGGDYITVAGDGSADYQHLTLMESTREIGFFNSGWYSSGRQLEPGNWYHVAVVKEDQNVKLYLNGEKIQESSQGFNNQAHPLSDLGITVNSPVDQGLALLDDIKIYSRVLSGREVKLLYEDAFPALDITYPRDESTVSGTLTIETAASDDKGITAVEFYIDGIFTGTDNTAPYTWIWDTENAVNAPHNVKAIAYDTIGNRRIDADTRVKVNNALQKTRNSIAGGSNFSLAVKADGTVWSWGYNGYGNLGDGSTAQRNTPVRVNGLTNVAAVACGDYFSLALQNDGSVWSWGQNGYGQLGDTTTIDKVVPVKVNGLPGIVAVGCGAYHSLALAEDGAVWGWGDNNNGELGLGDTAHRYTPVKLPDLNNVIALAAGNSSTLLLRNDGTVWSSGYNDYGELGDGTTTSRSTFKQVTGLENIIAIAGGYYYYLALKNDGTVYSWGYNPNGTLGDGTATNKSKPVKVNGLNRVVAIAAGNQQSFGLKEDGTVWGWGYNYYGELGDGTGLMKLAPVKTKNITSIVSIAAGSNYHILALKADGTLMSWGYNSNGQLGTGDTTNRNVPVPVSGLSGIALPDYTFIPETPYTPSGYNVTLSAGGFHSAYINPEDGSVWCWGSNEYGELGDGSTTQRTTPVRAALLNSIVSVAAGCRHTLALDDNGVVYTWGLNNYGQLGDGTTTNRSAAGAILTGVPIAAIAAGGAYNGSSYGYVGHSLALTNTGKILSWGFNAYGQLGDCSNTQRNSPVEVNGISHVSKIACGILFSMALKEDGTVWTWGYNGIGMLGDGSSENKYAPVQVESLSGIVDIAAGGLHAMALKADGTVYTWGYNAYGQLGNATTTNAPLPVAVNGLTGVGAIDCGFNHSLAVKPNGELWAWGYNGYGNLGDDTTVGKLSPALITTVPGVREISGSCGYDNSSIYSFTLALLTDGTVKSWGYNGHGELGNGNTTHSYVPVAVVPTWE